MNFTGVSPALITPFKNGSIDESAFRAHVHWVLEQGVHGVVPCGTTGEAGALSPEETRQVVRATVEETKGCVPVIAGAGANITAKAIALSTLCAEAGADALLHVTPYYNKPSQEGLYRHFAAIADATKLPIILYNVPGRTGVNLMPETVARLTRVANIVALKDACSDMNQSAATRTAVGDEFLLLSGEDGLNYPLYNAGHQGAISVTANVAPAKVAGIWNAWSSGDSATASRLHQELTALNQAMFFESNPIPVKTALALMGRCEEAWRLPLCSMAAETKAQLITVLTQMQLLEIG